MADSQKVDDIRHDDQNSIEVEIVSDLEFNMLDNAIQAAILQESNAAHSKETDNAAKGAVSTNIPAPFDRFRGEKGYLSVSNLVAQFWCEQQMEYNFLIPEQKPDTEEVQIGRSIHLARGTYATKLLNQSQGLQFKVNNGELVPFVQREINKIYKKIIISIYKAMI